MKTPPVPRRGSDVAPGRPAAVSGAADLVPAAAIVLLTLLVFGPTGEFDFVNLDDNLYILENPAVRAGLSWKGAKWAFTSVHASNWHPVAWISHMLDVSLFGLEPGWHHRVNVLLHAANALLLFLLLTRATGARWRSAFVAALFAVHPLHVESVAWVAERKDLLCAFFAFLAAGAYVGYARRGGAGRYAAALLLFALSLLSKPMTVTFPFLLLLADAWPLGRLAPPGLGTSGISRTAATARLLAEKIPFLALSAASCVVTMYAQRQGGAVASLDFIPLSARISNAAMSYAGYIGKTFWPAGLIVHYPHPWRTPGGISSAAVAGAALLLLAASALAVWQYRRRPYLLFGWLWYLGTLVPVIGLVQVGGQSMADRYTYIPLVGLFIAAAWGISGAPGADRRRRPFLAVAGGVSLVAAVAATTHQIPYWRDSEALFSRAVSIAPNDGLARNNLGMALLRKNRSGEALPHLLEAVRIDPNHVNALNNLGLALADAGRLDAAAAAISVSANPRSEIAHTNLGVVLERMGRKEEAILHYTEAIRIRPDCAEAHNNLGAALAEEGRYDEALHHFREALRARPDNPEARRNIEDLMRLRGTATQTSPRR